MKKYPQMIPVLISVSIIFSLVMYPIIAPILGATALLFSLAIGINTIFQKHKGESCAYKNIFQETGVLVFTLLFAMLLGGLAGMYANQFATQHFGVIAGILSALPVSFAMGYLVKWGIGKVVT